MSNSITNIKQYLRDIITSEELTESECVFEFLSKIKPDYNEYLIEELISRYQLSYINNSSSVVEILHYSRINEYFKNGFFVFKNLENAEIYAINNINVIRKYQLDKKDNLEFFLIKKNDFQKIIEKKFAKKNTDWAINYLGRVNNQASAKNIDYIKIVAGFCIVFFVLFFMYIGLFNLINSSMYLLQNFLKAVLFKRGLIYDKNSYAATVTDDMPIYSVIVPLYKEELKTRAILQSIKNLNYPKDKLDVKLVIEADDLFTIKALSVLTLPAYVHVVKVPPSFPRTKPKAMNYVMAYILGEFVTIYDAEDVPDPDQLLKALYAFQTLPDNYACVQAKLNFYNAEENLLTQFFSIEYSLWFEYLLKGLSLFNMPVTLGGTSNHFKVEKLQEVGFWDAYNVTEDADLGIRSYLKGYKVHLINSTTMEEAPNDVGVWISQRARWIKGFMQTIFVFMLAKKDYSKMSFLSVVVTYIFVGLSTYSFLCLPWLLIGLMFEMHRYIYYLWMLNTVFSLIYMYAGACLVLLKSKQAFLDWSIIQIAALLFWPFYFLLHTIAGYKGLWELVSTPFKWNKTPHGNEIDAMQ